MRFLRLIGAGLIAITAVVAVLFTAALVFFAGLAAYVLQLFRRPSGAARTHPAHSPTRRPGMRGGGDDVIDVVTTKVGDEPVKR